MAHGKSELRRRVWRRAHSRLPLSSEEREAALPGGGGFPGGGRGVRALQRQCRRRLRRGSTSSCGAAAPCLYPIYKSTFERGDGLKDMTPNMTASYRDHMVMWAKDVGRSVDYLESRPDIAKDKIGYLGFSWGAELAPLFLAVEPRISLG